MKQKKVYLMCGLPGSGKSTFIHEYRQLTDAVISRDAIRFSIVKEDEEYFAKEDYVFKVFIKEINKALEDENAERVFIDATHLNPKARYKVTHKLNKENIDEINVIYFNVPIDECIRRNNLRTGRAVVPETAIRNMMKSYLYPTKLEGFNHIYEANEEGEIIKEV